MKRTESLAWGAVLAALTSLAVLTGGYASTAAPARSAIRAERRSSCATPEDALRRYVAAVNAGDFEAQYALFAPVELGSATAPVPLLPANRLRRLLASLRPSFPSGLKLSARPLQTARIGAAAHPGVVGYYLVPVLDPGRPAPPAGRYSGSYVVAMQPSPHGWKVRAYASYWMYLERAYGHEAGVQFRAAYEREAERLGLVSVGTKAAPVAAAR